MIPEGWVTEAYDDFSTEVLATPLYKRIRPVMGKDTIKYCPLKGAGYKKYYVSSFKFYRRGIIIYIKVRATHWRAKAKDEVIQTRVVNGKVLLSGPWYFSVVEYYKFVESKKNTQALKGYYDTNQYKKELNDIKYKYPEEFL